MIYMIVSILPGMYTVQCAVFVKAGPPFTAFDMR